MEELICTKFGIPKKKSHVIFENDYARYITAFWFACSCNPDVIFGIFNFHKLLIEYTCIGYFVTQTGKYNLCHML